MLAARSVCQGLVSSGTQPRRGGRPGKAAGVLLLLEELLFLLGDRRFSGLKADLTVGADTERLGDRPTAAAQRELWPPPARVDLVAVNIYYLDLAFHQITAV